MKIKKLTITCGIIAAFIFAAIFGGAVYLVSYAVAPEDGSLCYESENFSIKKKTDKIKKQDDPQHVLAEQERAMAYPKLKKYSTVITMKSFDGLELKALFASKGEKASHDYALVIHGYRSEPRDLAPNAVYFMDKGWNVILPGQRGHGWSEGNYVDMGVFACRDMTGWCNRIVEMDPEARILLFGISMGGATVMMTSGEKLPSNVIAAIEDCGYSSVWEQFEYRLKYEFHLPPHPILDLASLLCKIKNGFSFRDGSSVEALANAEIPMLFIHGDSDDYVPYSMLEKNYEAKKGNKEMLVIKNAEHATACFVDPELYYSRVDDFVARWFK
ncbi:MAG: alpha/beta hydrolase [Treponema sp.]|nr:alpha/beta hydrolase [Candidatus Treponema equi]